MEIHVAPVVLVLVNGAPNQGVAGAEKTGAKLSGDGGCEDGETEEISKRNDQVNIFKSVF